MRENREKGGPHFIINVVLLVCFGLSPSTKRLRSPCVQLPRATVSQTPKVTTLRQNWDSSAAIACLSAEGRRLDLSSWTDTIWGCLDILCWNLTGTVSWAGCLVTPQVVWKPILVLVVSVHRCVGENLNPPAMFSLQPAMWWSFVMCHCRHMQMMYPLVSQHDRLNLPSWIRLCWRIPAVVWVPQQEQRFFCCL